MNYFEFQDLCRERSSNNLAYIYGMAFQVVEEGSLGDALCCADNVTDLAKKVAQIGARGDNADMEIMLHVTQTLLDIACAAIERAVALDDSDRRDAAAAPRKTKQSRRTAVASQGDSE